MLHEVCCCDRLEPLSWKYIASYAADAPSQGRNRGGIACRRWGGVRTYPVLKQTVRMDRADVGKDEARTDRGHSGRSPHASPGTRCPKRRHSVRGDDRAVDLVSEPARAAGDPRRGAVSHLRYRVAC